MADISYLDNGFEQELLCSKTENGNVYTAILYREQVADLDEKPIPLFVVDAERNYLGTAEVTPLRNSAAQLPIFLDIVERRTLQIMGELEKKISKGHVLFEVI